MVVVTLVLVFSQPIYAQENIAATMESSATLDQVSLNCRFTQDYINDKIKSYDLRARVNRLQAYRYISKRLETFTRRLENNNQPGASTMRQNVDSLNKAIESFKQSYDEYDAARSELSELKDCSLQPEEFLQKLEAVRHKRASVNTEVKTIKTIINPDIINEVQNINQLLFTKKPSKKEVKQ